MKFSELSPSSDVPRYWKDKIMHQMPTWRNPTAGGISLQLLDAGQPALCTVGQMHKVLRDQSQHRALLKPGWCPHWKDAQEDWVSAEWEHQCLPRSLRSPLDQKALLERHTSWARVLHLSMGSQYEGNKSVWSRWANINQSHFCWQEIKLDYQTYSEPISAFMFFKLWGKDVFHYCKCVRADTGPGSSSQLRFSAKTGNHAVIKYHQGKVPRKGSFSLRRPA